MEDSNNLVSSLLLDGQEEESNGGRPEGVAVTRANDVLPTDDKYRLAADLRRTQLELEDTKDLVSSLLAGQKPNGGGDETATATLAQAAALGDESQMADDLYQTTLELEETKKLVSSLLAGQTQSVEVRNADVIEGMPVHSPHTLGVPLNGHTAGEGENESGHPHYSVHSSRISSDHSIDTDSSRLSGSDNSSDSSSGSVDGRPRVLSVVAEGSNENSTSSSSALTKKWRAASDSPVMVDTTPRSTRSSGGESKLYFPEDLTCELSCRPSSVSSGAVRLVAASPVLGIEMSYPLPGNTDSAYLSMVRSGGPGPAITSGRQEGLQGGQVSRQASFSTARVAVCDRSAPPPLVAPSLGHSITTGFQVAGSKWTGGCQSSKRPISAAPESAPRSVIARATSGREMPISLVGSVKGGVRPVVSRSSSDGCLSTAEKVPRSAKQDPSIHALAPTLCPLPLAKNVAVSPTPTAMESMISGVQRFGLHGTSAPNSKHTASRHTPMHGNFVVRPGGARAGRRIRNARPGHRRAVAGVAAGSTSAVLKELDTVRTAIKQDTLEKISALKTEQMAEAVAEQSSLAATVRTAPCGERQTTVSTEVVDRPGLSARGGRRGATQSSAGARDRTTTMAQLTKGDLPLPLSRLEANAGKRMRPNATDAVAPRPGRKRASPSTVIGNKRVNEVRGAMERKDERGHVSLAR